MRQISTPLKSRLLDTVLLRRGNRVMDQVPTRNLVPGIREGKLLPTDEFSGDGLNWIPLGRHHQLSRLFPETRPPAEPDSHPDSLHFFEENPQPPPEVTRQLNDLADLLRDINR